MYELLPDRLYLGNALDARDPRKLFDQEIQAVVDVAWDEPPASLPRDLIYCRFPLVDGEGNAPALLTACIENTVGLLRVDFRTLVSCSAGMSRSPTIAAFALAGLLSIAPEEALARVAAVRTLELHPRLWASVLSAMS